MFINTKHQRGATMWGWLAVITMVGFITMLAFKIVPVYFDHRLVRSALQDVVDSSDFSNMSNKSIARTIQNRLTINNIRDIDGKAFQSKRDKTGAKYILIKYDRKVPVISNVSAIVEFNEEVRKSR